MLVEEIANGRARCTALGQDRWVDLMLLGETSPNIGDYLVIHLGFAQRIVSESEARESYALFEEILSRLDSEET